MASRVHVDLKGASGASYRFQKVEDPSRLPFIAGNFVVVDFGQDPPRVVAVGAAQSLERAQQVWPAPGSASVQDVFVRLNVKGADRKHELEDIAAAYQPEVVIQDD